MKKITFTLSIIMILLAIYSCQTNVKSVDIKGTFTKWSKGTPISLEYNSETMIWEAEKKIADINIPGNSGSPEFKFVLNGSSEYVNIQGKNVYLF